MKTVIIVKDSLDEHLSPLLSSVFDSVQVIHGDEDVISHIYMDPPDLILVESSYLRELDNGLADEFRGNTIYGHLPLVAVCTEKDIEDRAVLDMPIDDFIMLNSPESQIRRRIEFIARKAAREMDTNPLTRLPGNESIMRTIQQVLDEGSESAIAWVDLDNFKPYNDSYGFSSGDEVLMATARIITNTAKELGKEPTFVGHIGGDDFVLVCPIAGVEALCAEIISRFDRVIRSFYNEEDLEQGGIVSRNRRGEIEKFPLMTISIAVVLNEKKRYSHYGQAARDASEIKRFIKHREGSNYMLDRRGRGS
ncbi:MAG: diguanylate cyclase [Desulfomonilia bacterium]